MSPWSEFLRKLNPDGKQPLTAIWRMSDGAALHKLIPAADQVLEEELAADSAFSYKLYQIAELEFDQRLNSSAIDLETIEQAARTSGLIYRRKPDRISVRSPYTC